MPSTGSIIQLHHNNNFELLEFLTENNNNLYYKDKPIYTPSLKNQPMPFFKKKMVFLLKTKQNL